MLIKWPDYQLPPINLWVMAQIQGDLEVRRRETPREVKDNLGVLKDLYRKRVKN